MAQTKRCPKCQALTTMNAADCSVCGRVFQTTSPRSSAPPPPAAPAASPSGQTQVYTAPSHALAEYERQYTQLVRWQEWAIFTVVCGPLFPILGILFHVFWPLIAIATIAGLWLGLSGLLWVIGFVSGITMIVLVLTRKPTLRQKVAESGVDAAEWARPLDEPLGRILAASVGITIFTIALLTLVGTIARSDAETRNAVQAQNQAQTQRQDQESGQAQQDQGHVYEMQPREFERSQPGYNGGNYGGYPVGFPTGYSEPGNSSTPRVYSGTGQSQRGTRYAMPGTVGSWR